MLMKKTFGFVSMIAFLSLTLLSACAMPPMGAAPSFDAQPIPAGMWVPKADNLYFILDASSSMGEPYAGQTKFDAAKGVVAHFNQTMPDLNLQAALRAFGLSSALSKQGTALFFGPKDYSRTGLAEGVNVISQPGGPSPMAKALTAAAADLKGSQGPIAMVLISDGLSMAGAEAAAAGLNEQLAGRLCLYTVLVGDNPAGKALMEKIAATSSCGAAVSADSLASGAGMAAFVKDVLLTQQADSDGDGVPDVKDRCPNTPRGVKVDASGCPLDSDGDGVPDVKDRCPNTPRGVKVDASGCPLDSDGDGVYDYLDKCPGTPPGTKVDTQGCPFPTATKSAELTAAGTWLYKGVQFETNSAELKTSSYPVLDEIAAGLKAQPGLRVEVQGHTDNTGKADYNLALSQRRAQSACQYLIDKGVASERLIPKGYGINRPIDTNNTKEGRARNRRVELKPLQ
jgi:OOP family OmpA-OmpF porin